MEIKNKKKRKRELLARAESPLRIKIAILCGFSPGELPDYLEIFLLERGILPELYIGGYNRYYEDAVFGEELTRFLPDVIYFHTTRHNITCLPEITDAEAAAEKLEAELSRLTTMWDTARERFSCTIIQNNFELPSERPLGNLESVWASGAASFISALNMRMNEYARKAPGFLIQDIAYLSAREGLSVWHNPAYMHLYKYAVSAKCIPALGRNLASIIASVYGRRKKCLVLDLDGTLWGGAIGEDGVSGIRAGQGDPEGEAFLAFQGYVKRLSETGILLAAASKNDEAVALSGFSAEGMLLKREAFAAFYANWEPKHISLRKIAEELNIGLDSLVYIDDSPAERELIRKFLPEVSVIEASEPVGFLRELDQSGLFEPVSISDDDASRAGMYKNNSERRALKAQYEDYGEYLRALSMTCVFTPLGGNEARASALINKTNQFNLTGERLTEAQARNIAEKREYAALCGRLSDKFGDNGLVTVFIGRTEEGELRVLQWVMSCRVFGRGLEFAVFDEVVRVCRAKGIKRITGVYRPTPKNRPAEGLYEALGFSRIAGEAPGETRWEYVIPAAYANKNDIIDVRSETK